MQVFAEEQTVERRNTVSPSLAQPLPRLTPLPSPTKDNAEVYEVVIVGAGPAGLMLNLLLARYGLPDSSRLCIDSSPSAFKIGHADAVVQRTMEVLKSLDLADEIWNHGLRGYEFTRWIKDPNSPTGFIRQFSQYTTRIKARYKPAIVMMAQGRIERILRDDLKKYSATGITWNSRVLDTKIENDELHDFPVRVTLEQNGEKRTIRTRYLIGADGAHSVVRTSIGINQIGSMADDIWGVADIVVDTDFPDIRRPVHFASSKNIVSIIPRERKNDGEYLTRIYVPFDEDDLIESGTSGAAPHTEEYQRARRAKITPELILDRTKELFHPYYIRPKQEIEWWAAYQVGRRYAEQLVKKDDSGNSCVFLVGDACHTHSPALGQGMNVALMDSYDLAWKLMYSINGLTPNPEKVLDTFARDRLKNAEDLIDNDRLWYETRYQTEAEDRVQSENFIEDKLLAFMVGTIEYDEGFLVDRKLGSLDGTINSSDYSAGVLREGRRLADVTITRFADGDIRHSQDEFPSDGRFRVLVLCSDDLPGNPEGVSASALKHICQNILSSFTPKTVELVVFTPFGSLSFEWTNIPPFVKQEAEMRLHYLDPEGYAVYGVDIKSGAIAVVRPDGYVGTIATLDNTEKINNYLERCLTKVA
ncbi:phenol 2-monooxygenase [Paracoccidioides lutzii Pb01]|uniref:Phenol 2-monooxygenase n=1 Tax=Paracoccidioides lutzii (strain ATCC MYA-826 / Pb01) TaxID=502779 RepID=C1GSQ3_PARBA|nr:phenol 2-monooxygenase [Paracoccidioides lutzii Pb01]EEH39086.2 phenol 2-monooxygenase [Paracoccidioides lutzii Pb01]